MLVACTFVTEGTAKEVTDAYVDVVFANESGKRCEVFWVHNEGHGTYDEKFVKSIGPDEKYVERTHAAQKFFVKFDGKIGDAFITSDNEHQFHTIKGKSNQMSASRGGDL